MRALLLLVVMLSASLAGCVETDRGDLSDPHLASIPDHWSEGDMAPSLREGGPWFNIDGDKLTLSDLEGQVVFVDFWTYSCVNCIRTLPHINGLWATYKDLGFTIIGVHSPEFDFEKDPENVQAGIEQYDVEYPVVMDNDFDIWRKYQGKSGFWPAHFIFDANGEIRAYHRGEGDYAETEQLVRQLLTEAGQTDLPPPFESGEQSSSGGSDRTPELYVGYGRQSWTLGNDEGYDPGEDVAYTAAGAPVRDRVYLDGTWHNGAEAMTAATDGSVFLQFNAGAANFVVEGPMGECVQVLLDGEPIAMDLAGADVTDTADGPCIVLEETPRSYDFYAGPFEEHVVQFIVPAEFGLYTFAFSNQAMQ